MAHLSLRHLLLNIPAEAPTLACRALAPMLARLAGAPTLAAPATVPTLVTFFVTPLLATFSATSGVAAQANPPADTSITDVVATSSASAPASF